MKSIVINSESKQITERIQKEYGIGTFHQYHSILFDIGRMFKGQITYLELGCYAGASALLMLHREKTRVISVDSGKHVDPNIVKARLKKFKPFLDNKYTYIIGNTHEEEILNKTMAKVGESGVDILFIDAGHSYEDVIRDFYDYQPLVNPGGFIVFDDYHDQTYCPAVRKAVDWLFKEGKFDGYAVYKPEHNEYIIQKWQLKENIG
jgi:predicted O-methyltransferase YrrM